MIGFDHIVSICLDQLTLVALVPCESWRTHTPDSGRDTETCAAIVTRVGITVGIWVKTVNYTQYMSDIQDVLFKI